MRISSLFIDGFGLFHNASIKDLPAGLVLFQGHNEAGKSTLLAFIRTILFGFPGGRTKENLYPPFSGGKLGGQIEIRKDSGEIFVIERRPGKGGGAVTVTTSDGVKGGEEILNRLLGGTTRDLFKNVYAFSLSELQTFDTLRADAVKDAIYGASAGLSILTLKEAKSKMEQKISALFKPGGSKPTINQKLAELDEIRSRLQEASNGINEYDQANLEIRKNEEKILALQTDAAATALERNGVETYLKLWPDWISLLGYETGIQKLPVLIESFPDNGIVRLDNFKAKLQDSRDRLSELESHLEESQSEILDLAVDMSILNEENKISFLLDGLNQYKELLKSIPVNQQKENVRKQEIRRLLDSLGKEWNEEKVKSIDRSLFVKETILTFQEKLENAKAERVRGADALVGRNRELESIKGELCLAEKDFAKYSEPDVEVNEEVFQALQRGRDQFVSVETHMPGVKKDLHEAGEHLDRTIKAIDPGWERSNLESFDTSVSAQERVESFDSRLAKWEQEVKQAHSYHEIADKELRDLEESCQDSIRELEKIPALDVTKREELTGRKRLLYELRKVLSEQESVRREIYHEEERVEDKRQESERFSRVTNVASMKVMKSLAIGSAVTGILAAMLLAFFGRPVEGLIGGGLLIVVAVVLFIAYKKSLSGVLDNSKNDGMLSIESQIETILESLEGKKKKTSNLDEKINEYIEKLKLSTDVRVSDVENLESDVEEEIMVFDRWRQMADEIEKNKSDVDRLKDIAEKSFEKLEACKSNLGKTNDEWEETLKDLGLRTGTLPRIVSLVFTKIDKGKDLIRAVESLNERMHQMEATRKRYADLAGKVPSLTKVAAGPGLELISAVDLYFEQTSQKQKRMQEKEVVEQVLTDKKRVHQQAIDALTKAEASFKDVTEGEKEKIIEWQKWLESIGLDSGLSPATAPDAFRIIENCVKELNELEQLSTMIQDEEAKVDQFQGMAEKTFQLINRPPADEGKLVFSMEQLKEDYNQSKENSSRIQQIKKQIKKTHKQIESVKNQVSENEKNIAELIESADAKDEETFRLRGQLYEDRKELVSTIDQSEKNLVKITGETDLKRLKSQLSNLTVDQLKGDSDRLSRRQKEIEDELNNLRQLKSDLTLKMSTLASSEDISRLRSDEERVLEVIRITAADWGRHALALHLLNEAKRKFEEEQQPKVIRDAADFFKSTTNNEYESIVATIGEGDIEVVTKDMKRKKPEEMSRGTAEQLYLAIRFGYIMNYSANGEQLPIIMDDILVNFDPLRASQAASSILEIARNHQILYFSCHPETVAIFRGHIPDLPLYCIENGRMKVADYEAVGKIKAL